MGWIITSILFLVFVLVAWVISGVLAKGLGRAERNDPNAYNGQMWAFRIVVILSLLFIWSLSTITRTVKQVEAGHVGLVYTFGEITGQRGEGLSLIWPWQGFQTANVQIQTLAFVDEDDRVPEGARKIGDGLDSFTAETQNVYMDAILRIQVSPDNVQSLYREVGPDYVNKLIPGSIAQVFKDETVNYTAVEIAPAREQIRAKVEAEIRKELAPFSIEVDALLVENVTFDQVFTDAILQKQAATQEALRQRELVAAKIAEAEQRAAEAGGEAERLRITARGQADANNLINSSLTPLLIQFQALQKLSDNVQIALIPSGEGLIIDPATLLQPQGQ